MKYTPGYFVLKRCCFGMDYPSEPKGFSGQPKGFVPNNIPNIFPIYTSKNGEVKKIDDREMSSNPLEKKKKDKGG
jgi:hypothetical protein